LPGVRAVEISRFGAPDGLVVVERPEPIAGPGEVVVGVEASGVGGVDAVIRRGTLSGWGFEPGFVPGGEVAGPVLAVGPDVDPAWVGRRVWGATGFGGGYAERAVVAVGELSELPDGLGAVDAVAVGSAATVGRFALAHAHLAPGESVLVRGAAGSLGIRTVQLAAREAGRTVAVTTSSPERGERLRALGATQVLDRSGAGAGPATYDVVVDVVGGPWLPAFVDRLAPNGRLVLVGVVGGPPPAEFGQRLVDTFLQSRSVATFSLNTVPLAVKAAARADLLADAARGALEPGVDGVLSLAEAAEAHRRMDAGEVFGRVVLVP
jgi:NADPH:quinone reductase